MTAIDNRRQVRRRAREKILWARRARRARGLLPPIHCREVIYVYRVRFESARRGRRGSAKADASRRAGAHAVGLCRRVPTPTAGTKHRRVGRSRRGFDGVVSVQRPTVLHAHTCVTDGTRRAGSSGEATPPASHEPDILPATTQASPAIWKGPADCRSLLPPKSENSHLLLVLTRQPMGDNDSAPGGDPIRLRLVPCA